MHELTCPSCGSAAKFNLEDRLHLCQFCSTSFTLDKEAGQKEVFSDHYIIPNVLDVGAVKELVLEWLRRIHHNAGTVEQEYVVTDIKGFSLPYWVVSLDAHTWWKGLVKRSGRNALKQNPGAEFLLEKGEFRKTYRWAVSGRKNICETWGTTRLHIPKEEVSVDWDGFPLDSTLSRGRLYDDKSTKNGVEIKTAYDRREFFDYKYSNGLPIINVQVDEDEALRRAKFHLEQFHYKLAQTNVDYLVDFRTEYEITGVQLVHLPFWHVVYQYRPKTALRHFVKPITKNVLIEGASKGIIFGEIALTHKDKVMVNAVICSVLSIIFFLLGAAIHPAFFLVALFSSVVAGGSIYLSNIQQANKNRKLQRQGNASNSYEKSLQADYT